MDEGGVMSVQQISTRFDGRGILQANTNQTPVRGSAYPALLAQIRDRQAQEKQQRIQRHVARYGR
jgi:hypothetical protein